MPRARTIRDLRSLAALGVWLLLPWERARPTLRIFALHQREEGLVSVLANPWGTVFGIGAGIRHRAGGGISLGAEIPLLRRGRWEGCLVARADGVRLPDRSLGPGWYAGRSVGVSVNYATGEQP